MTKLIYKEQTYQLRGLIFEVRKALKSGWPEEVYHQALVQCLQDNDIPVLSKPRRTFSHRQAELHLFEPDLIVWDTIVLELKALPYVTEFAGAHYAQLIHYLKFFQKELGLLVNFGPSRAKVKRVIWTEPELLIEENYDAIKEAMSENDRTCLRQVRQSVLNIGNKYGLGYPETLYRKILAVELEQSGIACMPNVQIPARWNGSLLGQYATDHLFVADQYLLNIRSLSDYPPLHDFARMKTYLTSLGLKFGLLVNFSSKQLQIFGINSN
ncbi:MAG: GxxExxY protein [Anaerolineae bacterium]